MMPSQPWNMQHFIVLSVPKVHQKDTRAPNRGGQLLSWCYSGRRRVRADKNNKFYTVDRRSLGGPNMVHIM